MTNQHKSTPTKRWLLFREIINRHDPMSIVSAGVNDDEYDLEVKGLLAAIESASDPHQFAQRTEQVFRITFGNALQSHDWSSLANDLWQASHSHAWQ